MRIFKLAIACVGFSLAACTTLPEHLQVSQEQSLVSFIQTENQYQINQGKQARWGGVIADVKNFKDKTMLEVVHFSLRSTGRPLVKEQTDGRFRVYIDGFLDPMIYKKGKSVTALGRLSEKENGNIDEHEYAYAVLNASYIHLWKDIQQIDVRIQHQPFWHSPHYWYHPSPYNRVPLIIKSSANHKGKRSNVGK